MADWPLNFLQLKPVSTLTPSLKGARVILKSPSLKDYDQWAAVRRKNKNFLKPYEPEWSQDALSLDFFKRRLKRQDAEYTAKRGVFFLIHHRDTQDIIGGINLNNIQWGAARHAALGYWLDEGVQGQGYMKEATSLVINFAFENLNLRRLNAACLVDNQRSVNLLTRLGFEEEGHAKSYLQINGTWQDHRLFGLVRL